MEMYAATFYAIRWDDAGFAVDCCPGFFLAPGRKQARSMHRASVRGSTHLSEAIAGTRWRSARYRREPVCIQQAARLHTAGSPEMYRVLLVREEETHTRKENTV